MAMVSWGVIMGEVQYPWLPHHACGVIIDRVLIASTLDRGEWRRV